MKKIGLFFAIVFIYSCSQPKPPKNEWHIVLKTDRDGSVLHGSKGDLINAIRNGQDLKIGWGGKRKDFSIEHISEPIWLAILSLIAIFNVIVRCWMKRIFIADFESTFVADSLYRNTAQHYCQPKYLYKVIHGPTTNQQPAD